MDARRTRLQGAFQTRASAQTGRVPQQKQVMTMLLRGESVGNSTRCAAASVTCPRNHPGTFGGSLPAVVVPEQSRGRGTLTPGQAAGGSQASNQSFSLIL